MKQIHPDLWETDPEFPAPGLSTHAYLWTGSDDGNVLFYNTTHEHEIDRLVDLGGVARQYLSHQDEIAPSLRTIRDRFGARLLCHAAEADIVAETCPVDDTFSARRVEPDGIEVLPTPGHTPGSTCYLVPSARGVTYLFTGDSIYRGDDGTWHAGYIPGYSDREALAASLARLADLTPDVVVSSAFAGDAGAHVLDGITWAECVEQARAPLTEGASRA